MADRRLVLLLSVLILLAGGCRRTEQPAEPPSPPERTQQTQQVQPSGDGGNGPAANSSKAHGKPEQPPKPQRLNPAFPYPNGYKPEIRLDPPPVPPEIVGPSPPISLKNQSSPP